jgi:hypothetical protein
MPSGWVVDWITRYRLSRLLRGASSDVVGVAAPSGALTPGSSFRTHAERRALLPLRSVELDRGGRVDGAVLLRPGSAHRLGEASVEVDGTLLVDHGAHVHDPSIPEAETTPATPDGRSPFPVRPVVLFVGSGATPFDDRFRRVVNDLLAVDVEARLAVPTVPRGSHLTRPCSPDLASFRALVPDIVVPIDPGATELAGEWGTATSTSVIVVEMMEGAETELSSWRRNSASSPVRARVGLDVDVKRFATLVNRLSAGPRPLVSGSRLLHARGVAFR